MTSYQVLIAIVIAVILLLGVIVKFFKPKKSEINKSTTTIKDVDNNKDEALLEEQRSLFVKTMMRGLEDEQDISLFRRALRGENTLALQFDCQKETVEHFVTRFCNYDFEMCRLGRGHYQDVYDELFIAPEPQESN
jgi:hypothetical protein